MSSDVAHRFLGEETSGTCRRSTDALVGLGLPIVIFFVIPSVLPLQLAGAVMIIAALAMGPIVKAGLCLLRGWGPTREWVDSGMRLLGLSLKGYVAASTWVGRAMFILFGALLASGVVGRPR